MLISCTLKHLGINWRGIRRCWTASKVGRNEFRNEYERGAHHSEANVGVTAWTKGGGGVMCIMSRPVWDCRCMVLCVCMSC